MQSKLPGLVPSLNTIMISAFKLPFQFEPIGLKTDLAQLHATDWVSHFNKGYFEGDWTGVALRSVGGLSGQLYPDPQAKGSFADTPILGRCPNIRAALTSLNCPLRSVRLLKLEVGSLIKEHRDYDLGYEKEQLRLHVPVTTNPDVDFFLDGHRLNLNEGECWYLDLSLPHWVENRGSSDRIHLVIDCELNEWLGDLIQFSAPANELKTASTFSSPEELERFRQLVLSDLTLQQRLRETADPESFVRLVVDTGHQRGCYFTAQDTEAALQTARREWAETWIN